MPLLIAIVLAYLLEVPIRLLERFMPRTLSVVIVAWLNTFARVIFISRIVAKFMESSGQFYSRFA